MTKDYKIVIETPNGKCDIEAETWDDLMFLTPEAVSEVVNPSREKPGIDATIKIVRQELAQKKRNRPRSAVAQAGLEGEVIKCYLRGMTAHETVEWLRTHRAIKCSKSSIGRYWIALSKVKTAYMSRGQ